MGQGTRTLKKPKAWWDNPNAFEEKRLYINLRYHPIEENPDDNYKFEFLTLNGNPEINESNYWFKVGDILNLESVLDYTMDNSLTNIEGKILEKLKDAFCTKSLISFFEETEKNLDKVLKIFIRVNSGGTQLSYSDLLMSILTANFSTDIRDLMNKFVDSIRDQGFGVMGRDQILKTCLILTESNHIFKLKNFSKSNISKIENNWTEITEKIFTAIKLLTEFGYTNRLSSAYILSNVAYYLYSKQNITAEDKSEILKFVRNTQITSYFTTSLDAKLEVVAKIVRNSSDFKDINKNLEISIIHPLKISEDDVERMLDIQYGNPAILPILQQLYPNLDYKNSTFHIDHIYPKSKFKTSNKSLIEDYLKKANFLFNLQLLQGDENISKKAKDPEIWLNEHFNKDIEYIKAYKERNYITRDFSLDWENIEDFDKMRSKNLIKRLKEIFIEKSLEETPAHNKGYT